jgi:Prp8 binding protein
MMSFPDFWNVHGECENISMMSGHSGAVMELHFTTDGSQMTSASTDKTVALWDIEAGVRVKRLKGHTSFVNSCHPVRRGPLLICSGSDDGTIRIWDPRKRGQQQAITLTSTYQVTAVSFNDTAQQVFSGGIDNEIKVRSYTKVCKKSCNEKHIVPK